jgi:hypothetical protein
MYEYFSQGWLTSANAKGPLVRIAPNEVSVSDPAAVKIIYNIKSGFTKVRCLRLFHTSTQMLT